LSRGQVKEYGPTRCQKNIEKKKNTPMESKGGRILRVCGGVKRYAGSVKLTEKKKIFLFGVGGWP